MSNGFVKMRGGVQPVAPAGAPRFGDQVNHRSQTSQRRQRPAGEFDRWFATENATWIRVSPMQSWQYNVFNRETKQVEGVTTPWYEYVSHFIASKKRSFVCSGGPARDNPCYGDAVRAAFYEEKKKREEMTGIREEAYAPVSASSQFALSLTVMETIYSVALRNPDGTPRLSKAKKPIYNYVPESRYMLQPGEAKPPSKFGHNAHWSMGIHALKELQSFDEMLRNKCARTGNDLLGIGTICPDCSTPLHDLVDTPVTGEDLFNLRRNPFSCNKCGYNGIFAMQLAAPDGGPVQEGGIMAFDLRIKAVPLDDKKKALQLVGLRMPARATDADVQKLVNTPLSLPEIFAPSDLQTQVGLLGDLAKGIDPKGGILATGYGSEGGDEGTEGGDIAF